jgi:hypothetical protein
MRVTGVTPMGGVGKVVEADETFYGRLEGQSKKGRTAWANKNVVLTPCRARRLGSQFSR